MKLLPAEKRDSKTLIKIIKENVATGSTIYSDGWPGYHSLIQEGYNHYVVEHKYPFSAKYKNLDTGEVISVNTNMIEGAWKHAKVKLVTIILYIKSLLQLFQTHISFFYRHFMEILYLWLQIR